MQCYMFLFSLYLEKKHFIFFILIVKNHPGFCLFSNWKFSILTWIGHRNTEELLRDRSGNSKIKVDVSGEDSVKSIIFSRKYSRKWPRWRERGGFFRSLLGSLRCRRWRCLQCAVLLWWCFVARAVILQLVRWQLPYFYVELLRQSSAVMCNVVLVQ